MSDEGCVEDVWEPPGFWHHHRCRRPVKATIHHEPTNRTIGVCGIHLRAYMNRGNGWKIVESA